ncbi:hypothetical protein Acr_01g0008060 [Actinidia rufa]|uniref:Integrase zinc-binding domain-containing protein n=1 Tax=Actinidia rufa TaxID=165716 RepID=A0A7J0E5P7_9ERIC|nr:hypothetical protein Acr_01g0008060 [Actinidia rufa]
MFYEKYTKAYAEITPEQDLWRRKTIRQGYFWPTIERDAAAYIKRCDKCQKFRPRQPSPSHRDGTNNPAPGHSPNSESQRLSSRTTQGSSTMTGSGYSARISPSPIISPRPVILNANGQVEVTNRTILRNLKARLERSKSEWAKNLPSILWAYHTTSRIPTGETPYSMVFGTESVILVENRYAELQGFEFRRRNQ